jgi:hypothetical protein
MKIKKINEKMMIKSIILMNYFNCENISNILSERLKENKYIYNFTYI